MGKIGYGYGSECHLLRWMGRHRNQLDCAVREALEIPKAEVEWLDFTFNPSNQWADEELKGVDFLLNEPGGSDIVRTWKEFWPDPRAGQPTRQGIHSWDAVGRIHLPGEGKEWLLVEAKANETEFLGSKHTACQAGARSRAKIIKALEKTAVAMQVSKADNEIWLEPGCYQLANRLATLHFLLNHAQPCQQTRILFIYFTKDSHRGWTCPSTVDEWRKLIVSRLSHMGIGPKHAFSSRVHHLFLDVKSDHYDVGLKV